MTDATDLNEAAIRTLRNSLDRAHQMWCSDPGDPTRHTTYSQARDAIDALQAALRVVRQELAHEVRISTSMRTRAEAAESVVEAARALHRSDGRGGRGPFCVECSRAGTDDKRWPCATIRATEEGDS